MNNSERLNHIINVAKSRNARISDSYEFLQHTHSKSSRPNRSTNDITSNIDKQILDRVMQSFKEINETKKILD